MSRLLQDGQNVQGTYEVERYLGQGAFAEVYRVRHRILGRQAMKVFKQIGTVEETERMLDEAIMLTQIRHPNIVSVYNADTVDTSAGRCGFFTMEYVAGGSLHDFWSSHGDRFVPVATVVDLLIQICSGLAVAHSERPPVVHRDLTPQNILVGYERDGLRARISDFGLAKRVDPLNWLVSTQGTIPFKAPEALRDPKLDSTAGDVWAIGTIAYLLLTDVLPYEDPGGAKSFLGAHIQGPPRSPRDFNAEVDPDLDRIVLGALAPEVGERYPNAGALERELTHWRDGRPRRSVARAPSKPDLPGGSTHKGAIGTPSPSDRELADRMVAQALQLSRRVGTLPDAADLMEEAFNKDSSLRSRYERRVGLWRKGVVS